jgi:hypothetical protein
VTTLVLSTALAPTAVLAETPTTTSVTTAQQGSAQGILDLQKADGWAQDAIVQAKQLGLMNGDPSGRFRPTDRITRAEFAVILSRLLQLDTPAVQASSFADVPASHWGLAQMEAVKAAGVMLGDGGGIFRPDEVITREELAVLLVKASQNEAEDGEWTVADHAEVSGWAQGYVQKALTLGLMSGDGTNFAPRQSALRQEVAMAAVNFVKKVPSKFTIAADSQVTVKGIPYGVVDPLKPLFSLRNAAALKNAVMRFEVKDKTITKITYLELANGGREAAAGEKEFSGNAVLATIDGDLVVGADYLSVLNLNVTGNLEVSKNVQHDFYSSHVAVGGQTLVNGGDANTVVFDSATLRGVVLNKPDVHVQAANGTAVEEMVVKSNARIEALGVTIPKVTVESGVTQLHLDGNGTIANLNVADQHAKVTLQAGTKVTQVVLPSGVQAADVFVNYEQVKGQIGGNNGNGNGNGNNGNSDNHREQTNMPNASDITFVETGDHVESVVVKNVPANTKVRIYDANLQGNLLGEAVSSAASSRSDVTVHLTTPLSAEGESVFVSLQTGTFLPSLRTEVLTGWVSMIDLTVAHKSGVHAFEAALTLKDNRTLADLNRVEVSFLYKDENEDTVLATLESRPQVKMTTQGAENELRVVAAREQKANDPDPNWKHSDWNGNHFQVPNGVLVKVTDLDGHVHTSFKRFGDLSAPALAAVNKAKTAEALRAVLEDDLKATALGVDTTLTSTYARLSEQVRQQLLQDLVGTYAQTNDFRVQFESKINEVSRMTPEQLKAATQAVIDMLPETDGITLDNYSAVLQQVELAEGLVAECTAQGISLDELNDLYKVNQARQAVDAMAAAYDQERFLAAANDALAQLPDAEAITVESLPALKPQIDAATAAVKAARANGSSTYDFTGLEKLVRVTRLKVDQLFATDENGELDKTRLAPDFTEDKLFEVADLFDGLVDPTLTAFTGKDRVQARHDYVEAMQRIKSLGLGNEIYLIGDDMNLAYILYLVQGFERDANLLPPPEQATLGDRGNVAFLLDMENSIVLLSGMVGVFIPNYEEFDAAALKLHAVAGALAPAVVESLFTDNTHSQLAEGVDQGKLGETSLFVKYADESVQADLYAIVEQAQQMFADQSSVVPEIILAWTENNPEPDYWNKELVAGDKLLVAGNKRGKVYLVPNAENPYSVEALEALVAEHRAASAAITGAGEGLVGEMLTNGLPSTEYRLFIADQFGNVKYSKTIYRIVDNVVPYVVWPLRDLHLKVNEPVPFVDLRFTFQDTEDDSLELSVKSSDESVIGALMAKGTMHLMPFAAGTATITVTATDTRGASCDATFQVLVDPADPNHDPVVSLPILDQTMTVGDADLNFDMTHVFIDEENDNIEILVPTSSDESVATVAFDGINMSVHAVGPGTATITVIAVDGKGGPGAVLTFRVQVS